MMVACKPQVPKGVIEPDDMEDLLVDYHLARAMAIQHYDVTNDRDYYQQLYTQEAFRKHGVTKADFDSSLVYYYSRSDVFEGMYKRVNERLDKQALALGASEGEIGRYANLNAHGDTANIWTGDLHILLLPIPPKNRYEFEIEVDSTFLPDDTFLLQFVSDYIYQTGSRDGVLVLSIAYEGDTVVTRSTHFSNSGVNQLRLESPEKLKIKQLRGFFYLGGGNDPTTTLRLLFLNSIQLIRFHKNHAKESEPKAITADSVTSVTIAQRPDTATTSVGNTQRPSRELQPADRRAPLH